MLDFRGSYPVLITPMDQDQEVDYGGWRNNIEYFIEQGVAGICILGSTGEFVSLTKEERLEVAETVVKQVDGRIPVLVGTAAESTREAVMYTKHAQAIGADGALIITPYYSQPTEDELYDHYQTISSAVNIPIMLYNNPSVSGLEMSNELMLRLGHECENITHIKESTGNIRKLRELTENGEGFLKTFCGWDDMALESFLVGATGWISVAGNIIPAQVTQLFNLAVEQKEYDAAWQLYQKMLPLLQFLESSGKLVQISKFALDQLGQAGGAARAPRKQLNLAEQEKLKEILANLALVG